MELEEELPQIIASLEEVDNGLVTAKQMVLTTAEDKVLRGVIRYTQFGWPRKLSVEQEGLRPFWNRKNELSVQHNLLYWGHRVIIPDNVHGSVLKLLHETHRRVSH